MKKLDFKKFIKLCIEFKGNRDFSFKFVEEMDNDFVLFICQKMKIRKHDLKYKIVDFSEINGEKSSTIWKLEDFYFKIDYQYNSYGNSIHIELPYEVIKSTDYKHIYIKV